MVPVANNVMKAVVTIIRHPRKVKSILRSFLHLSVQVYISKLIPTNIARVQRTASRYSIVIAAPPCVPLFVHPMTAPLFRKRRAEAP